MIDTNDWLEDRIILKVYGGSTSYGTSTSTSDVDIRGVCIPPKNYIFGFDKFEQYVSKEYTKYPEYSETNKFADVVIYGLHHFIRLAANSNANIMGCLFVDKKYIISINELGQMLLDNRSLFLTKKVKSAFGNFAFNQLKRLGSKLSMEESKRKIENNAKQIREYEAHIAKLKYFKMQLCNMSDLEENNFADLINIDTEIEIYNGIIDSIKRNSNEIKDKMGYSNFNPKGKHKDSIDLYGYDTKYAMHSIRLLNMGIEILNDGECNVLRKDSGYLLDIKNGKYPLEYIREESIRLFKLLDEAYNKSLLPESPDMGKINNLLCDMTMLSFEKWG